MQKSQMMMMMVVMAVCCFSSISSLAMIAGIGGSVGPIAQFFDAQENDLQYVGTIGEVAERLCQECQAANWDGNATNTTVPCAELKQNCIDEGLL